MGPKLMGIKHWDVIVSPLRHMEWNLDADIFGFTLFSMGIEHLPDRELYEN